ncbi:MAG: hypothetical protein JWO59_3243 [Chloroflexi bacterium]|nr:hypothetical protein [Chloroflexota bacterium]
MTPRPQRWLGRDRSDVFVSYCREDLPLATELDRYLHGRGLSTWIDSGSLLPGSLWEPSVEIAIRYAGVFLAITTPLYRDSSPCKVEYEAAYRAGKYIVCIGTAPWAWGPEWGDKPPGVTVIESTDGAAVYAALASRLADGRRQADLEQAAATFAAEKSLLPSFRGRRGMRRARDTLAAVRRAGLPTTDASTRFVRHLRRRLMWRRAQALATVITVFLVLLWLRSSFTQLGQQRQTSESRKQQRHRIAESQSLAAEMIKEKESGSASQSRLLDLAVRAYDQSPTPAAIAALREVLAITPHAEDLHAVALPGRVIAVRLTAAGQMAGLTADGTFVGSSGKIFRVWRPKTSGGELRSGWIAADGSTVLVLSDTGDLGSASGDAARTVLAAKVDVAAANDDQTVYAVARGTTLQLYERSATGPGLLRCTLRRLAAVTAVALSPKGDTLAMGERGDAVTVVNTATCTVRAVPRPTQRLLGIPDPLDSIVAVAVADDGRAVSFATRASVSMAQRDPAGHYSVSTEQGSPADTQVYLSADGAIHGSSYGSFAPISTSSHQIGTFLHLPGEGLSQVTAAQFSRDPDGRWRCVAGTAAGGLFSMKLDEDHETFPHPIGLVADGILTTTADQPWKQPVVLTDRPIGGRPRRWHHPRHDLTWRSKSALVTAPRGEVAALAGTNGRITVLGPNAPAARVTVHGLVALTPTGRYLLSVEGGQVKRWRIDLPRLRRSASVWIKRPSTEPVAAVTALGENQIVVARLDGTLEIIDLRTGTVTARITDAVATHLASSPAGDRLAVLTNHTLQLRDPKDLRPLKQLPLTGALDARFATDGMILAVSTADNAKAFSIPDLFTLLNEPLYGNDTIAFPALPWSAGVLLPTGTWAPVCALCSTTHPARLRDTAGRILYALRLAGD